MNTRDGVAACAVPTLADRAALPAPGRARVDLMQILPGRVAVREAGRRGR